MNWISVILSRKWLLISIGVICLWSLILVIEGGSKIRMIMDLRSDIRWIQEQIENADETEHILASIQDQRSAIISQYSALNDNLPELSNVSMIIRELQDHLSLSGVSLLKLEPENKKVFETYEEWPFLIIAEGGYHNFGHLLQALEKSDYIIRIQQVTLSSDGLVSKVITGELYLSVVLLNELSR